jgi:hypothetical protein
VTVQRRLGHKVVCTTLQLYGHLFPEKAECLTARLNELRERSLVSKMCPDEVARFPAAATKKSLKSDLLCCQAAL